MNSAMLNAVRAGLSRGWIEYRQTLTTPQDLVGYFGMAAFMVVLAWLMRDGLVDGTDVPIAAMWITGLIGFMVATNGLISASQVLATEREDGTLLRAKALPKGMTGYLTGKALHILLISMTSMAIMLVPAYLLFEEFGANGLSGWLTFAWVLLLGLLATAPIGAIVGSLMSNPRTAAGVVMLPFMVLMGISGIIYQVTGFPEWLQWVAQIFPVYWVALGMRSAFLPDAMLAVEINESWRHLETAGVLGLWAIIGFIVAGFVLRRMARRVSGARVEAARKKMLQRAL